MPGISIHYDIRQAGISLVQAQCGIHPLLKTLPATSIKNRFMPKVGEVVDPLPCVIAAPVSGITWEPLDFEDNIDRVYLVEWAIVAASNQDYLANQELYEGWLYQISKIMVGDARWLLAQATPPISSVWLIEIDHSATFDRSKLNINYAYQSILGIYHNQEKRNS